MQLISLEGPYRPLPDCQSALDGSLMQLLKFKPPSIVYVTLQCQVREYCQRERSLAERDSLLYPRRLLACTFTAGASVSSKERCFAMTPHLKVDIVKIARFNTLLEEMSR